ncbi:MAG TPA: class I SAM-dependent methyltransferase [Steroidobacteraceae bacterium]|jgi:caffeoyl-CoA O-methyltransferase|nr:class I SAM-dependent methyltransferase [Steroidobacteraceae bacterium]
MSRDSINLSTALGAYLRRVGTREDADLASLRTETASHPRAEMQISPEQGQLMAVLVRMLGARKTLEVGVFTGYSSMVVAKAMGPEGKVVALDVSEEFTAIARRHWAKAGVANRIELRLRPAAESLQELVAQGASDTFDFAFIDADKANYDTYYEYALKLVRRGGLIAIDNVLWNGMVIDPTDRSADTVAIRAINEKIHGDERVDVVMVPVGDGLTLALKR